MSWANKNATDFVTNQNVLDGVNLGYLPAKTGQTVSPNSNFIIKADANLKTNIATIPGTATDFPTKNQFIPLVSVFFSNNEPSAQDSNLEVKVFRNGVQVNVQTIFTNTSGTLEVQQGDTIQAEAFSQLAWAAGTRMKLEFTGLATKETSVNGQSLVSSLVVTGINPITIAAYTVIPPVYTCSSTTQNIIEPDNQVTFDLGTTSGSVTYVWGADNEFYRIDIIYAGVVLDSFTSDNVLTGNREFYWNYNGTDSKITVKYTYSPP